MLQFTELRPLALYNVSGQTKTKKDYRSTLAERRKEIREKNHIAH